MDFCAVTMAVGTASWWTGFTNETQDSWERMVFSAASLGLLTVLLLDKHGDYRACLSLLAVRETERLLRVTALGLLLAMPIAFAQFLPWISLVCQWPWRQYCWHWRSGNCGK